MDQIEKTNTEIDKTLDRIKQVKFSEQQELDLEKDVRIELSSEEIQALADEEFSKEYPDSMLYWVFLLNFFCSVLVNVDHGSLPGCTEEVKTKLDIHNFGFGALGTAVYAGLTVGSALGTKAYQNSKNIKWILATSLTVNAAMLFAFTITTSFAFNFFVRFFTGVAQVFITIFTPVWADAFGSEKLKSLWITVLLICSPLGVFLGFTITSVLT